jgi:quercetin dioxygenase-like cupin family protein
MAVSVTPGEEHPPTEPELSSRLANEGLSPHSWANAPHDSYGWHQHGYTKVLYCVQGGIVFHTAEGDFALGPGDRLVVPAGTPHAATVGDMGVRCVEAAC